MICDCREWADEADHFANNAMMGASLFGAIAVAGEYGHATVVPMFLAEPRRHPGDARAVDCSAVRRGILSLVGAALTVVAVALALPATD